MSSFGIPFHDVYRHLLTWVLSSPEQRNERTGKSIRVGRGGTSFRIELGDRILPTVGLRKTFPKSAAAEVAWFLQGTQDVTWLARHAPFWDKFTEADGKTIESAYGHRWVNHFGRDQLSRAVLALRLDPSNRRVYIGTWDPATDGLDAVGQKNVPCPVGFSLSILDGELHSTVTLRSSDLLVGLPYDVMGHALLMDAISASLGVRLGVMQVVLAHPHLYEDHYDMALECLKQEPVVPGMALPGWTLAEVTCQPDLYVERHRQWATAYSWPSYNPKPLVVE